MQGLPGAEGELAVDGKRLRGSRREGETALQVITLAGTRLQEVWEQRAGEGGDELGAAIALLEGFPPEGEVIGADAGLLQASFVQKVMEKRGLHRLDQRQSARVASGDGGLDRFVARPPDVVSCPKGHGRPERRSPWIWACGELSASLAERFGWQGVRWCGRIERTGKEETGLQVWIAGRQGN